jgi:formylmethanofuran dehydrogenase subunit E
MFLNVINALSVTNMIHKQHVIESSYKCEECGESFHNRGELDDHVHQMH